MGILDFAEIPLLLLFPPQLGVARIHTNRVCTYIHVCMQVNCAQSQWSKEKKGGGSGKPRTIHNCTCTGRDFRISPHYSAVNYRLGCLPSWLLFAALGAERTAQTQMYSAGPRIFNK